MYDNSKKTEDAAGNCPLVVVVTSFSVVCESNKSVWCILGVGFAWGYIFMYFMGCSAIKSKMIHYGMVRASWKVAYEVLDTLECWCRWGRIVARKTVDGAHEIGAGILDYVYIFYNLSTEFSHVVLLQVMDISSGIWYGFWEVNFKGVVFFECSGKRVDSFSGIWKPLCKYVFLGVFCLINDYQM